MFFTPLFSFFNGLAYYFSDTSFSLFWMDSRVVFGLQYQRAGGVVCIWAGALMAGFQFRAIHRDPWHHMCDA